MQSELIEQWNPTRILLLGDTHAHTNSVVSGFDAAQEARVDVIVQLGDFGYWPHNRKSEEFLATVEDYTEDTGIRFLWIDGNHENHDAIDAMYHMQDKGSMFWGITDKFVHAHRGARWEWSGRRFLACGGAYSIDKDFRTPGHDWFPQETITYADVSRCGTKKVDVLLTHDAPPFTPNVIWQGDPGYHDRKYPHSWGNRQVLAEIVQNTQPKIVCHGHYHRRNTAYSSLGPRVEGFGCNMDQDKGILDLTTLTITEIA